MALLVVGTGCTGASSEQDSAVTSSVECADSWVSEGQVVIEPDSCLRWSPRSEDEMDWYAAVDPDDAVAGGCTAHCDEDDVGWCDEVEGLEGLSGWRLPDIGELEDTALRSPPFDELEGYLWSRTSDDYMEQ
ncbi:MAG: hypothetical protein QGG40_09415, partial [Myxococcota bacterium]|nr:hypothetical protein [Myxococcota bacterium]